MKRNNSISTGEFLTQSIKKNQRIFLYILTPLIALTVIFINVWEIVSVNNLRYEYEENSYTELDLVAESTLKSLEELWADQWMKNVCIMASNETLIAETEKLLALESSPEQIKDEKNQKVLRELYVEKLAKDSTLGFFIISPNNISLASSRTSNLATTNLIALHKPEILQKIKLGKPQMIPPIPSDVKLTDTGSNDITMFFGAPIYNSKHEYIATFVIRVCVYDFFRKILKVNWFKNSGDIYAIDEEGYILSQPRFFSPNANFISDNPDGPKPGTGINFKLKNEYYKLAQKLIHEQGITTGNIGGKDAPFKDYRNKSIHGKWKYIPNLNLGIFVKIDEKEAMASYEKFSKRTWVQLIWLDLLMVFIMLAIGATIKKFIGYANKREKYFSTIINKAGDGIIIINSSLKILQVNHSIEKLLGTNIEELRHQSIFNFTSKEYIKLFRKQNIAEISINGKKRKNIPIRLSLSKASFGTETIGILLIHDISEEINQRNDVKKLSTIVEQSPMSIVLTNKNWEIEYANKQFEIEYGFTLDEVVSKNSNIFVPEDPQIEGHYPSITIEKSGIWQGEMLNMRKNGEEFWVSATITGIKNDKDEITHYVSIKKDITEEKKQEALYAAKSKQLQDSNLKLKQSQKAALSIMQDANMQRQRAEKATKSMTKTLEQLKVAEAEAQRTNYMLRMVIDNIPGRVFWKDKDLNYLGCNNYYALDSGKKSPEEIVGKNDFEIFPKDIAELYQSSDLEIMKTGIPMVNFDSPIIDNKGNRVEVRTNKVALTNSENESEGILGMYEDVTELNETKSQLIKAKEKAEESDRLKSEFIANMSHEIRTPMNAVLGFAEILDKKNKEATHDQYIKAIKTSGKTLLNIINDILDLSKIEAGKLNLQYNPVNLENVLNEISSMFIHKAREKGIDMQVNVPANLPKYLLLDELRIRQIILNLTSNALKFTQEGSINLILNIEQQNETHLDLRFAIADTGIGIPQEAQTKIFKAFVQQEHQDTKKYGGTGLGLAISNKLANMMDSSIELKSKEGRGSEFSFSLKQVEIYTEEIKEDSEKIIDPDTILFNKARVLIVDDVKNNREILKEYLSSYALEIFEAENGQQALSTALATKPNLIFMDIRMPEMDGFEATNKIRSYPELKNIPVVALTASAFASVERKAKSLGFDAYLRKPVGLSSIVNTTCKFIKHTIIEKTPTKNILENKEELNLKEIPENYKEALMPILEKLQNRKSNKLLETLSTLLIEIGEKEKLSGVAHFGDILLESVHSFNIDKTQVLLKKVLMAHKELVN